MMKTTFRVFWTVLLVCAGLGTCFLGYVAFVLARAEDAAWDRGDFSEVARREDFLKSIATAQILPESMISRAHGLLGDLAHVENQFEDASGHYQQAMTWLSSEEHQDTVERFPAVLNAAPAGKGRFGEGWRSFLEDQSAPAAVDDRTLQVQVQPHIPSGARECGALLVRLGPLPEGDHELAMRALRSIPEDGETSEALELVAFQEERIKALRGIRSAPFFAEVDDLEGISSSVKQARLLMLDALCRANAGDEPAARSSFEAALHLIQVDVTHPRLISLIGALGVREEFAELLESNHGQALKHFFKPEHVLRKDALKFCASGEYQNLKRILTSSLPTGDPQTPRLLAVVLRKQAAFWSGRPFSHASGTVSGAVAVNRALSEWNFRHRRHFHRSADAGHTDGWRAASELLDWVAEIVNQVATPMLGDVEKQFQDLRTREELLAAFALMNR